MASVQTGSCIFRERLALDLDYLPDRLVHRDPQIDAVYRAFQPLMEGVKPRSILGLGLLGTGKTAVARFVTNHFARQARTQGLGILTTYISCIRYRGMYDVLLKAAQDILGRNVDRGHARGHYVDILEKKVTKSQGFILILDEVDRLALRKTGDFSDLLYTISRNFPRTCAIMLTSKRKVADVLQHDIDGRSRDTFRWHDLDFPSYNAFELADILNPRVDLAFRPEACGSGIVGKICAICVDQGLGARGAIDIARRAGEMAESVGELAIREEDVDLAAHEMIRRLVRGPIQSLDRQCRIILHRLVKKESVSIKELENYYSTTAQSLKAGDSREALYYHLGHLREAELIVTSRVARPHGQGSEGRIEIDPSQLEVVKEAMTLETKGEVA